MDAYIFISLYYYFHYIFGLILNLSLCEFIIEHISKCIHTYGRHFCLSENTFKQGLSNLFSRLKLNILSSGSLFNRPAGKKKTI